MLLDVIALCGASKLACGRQIGDIGMSPHPYDTWQSHLFLL
jgi:hypothetical protein